MSQLSVSDQKQLKQLLAKELQNRKNNTCASSLRVYLSLIPLNLNLYFKSFLLAAPNYKQEEEFWNNLFLLESLGSFLSHTKAYYRQSLITEWIKGLMPGHNVMELFNVMKVGNPLIQLNYLIESDSFYGYYIFLKLAVSSDIETSEISKLIKKLLLPNDKCTIPQNIREDTVNFLTHYFNINDIKYPFHRELDHSLFAFAEKNYESFLKVIIPASRIKYYLDSL